MSDREDALESGLVSDIAVSKAVYEQLVQFHWEYYSELLFQRRKIYGPLKSSLRERAGSFEFQHWQRAVKYRYSLDPLGTKGSVVDPGGRFNIGAIDTVRYPVFAGLYLASDKGTALGELLGRTEGASSLSPEETALTKADSITVVSVSGKLESVLDIRHRNNLSKFVFLISRFKLSGGLIRKARKLGFPTQLVRTAAELQQMLHQNNWREWPALYDVPSSTQIFGRIVCDAGIEAILYDSVLTHRPCLAVFPQNFVNSPSYVELEGPLPADYKVPSRLDGTTHAQFC